MTNEELRRDIATRVARGLQYQQVADALGSGDHSHIVIALRDDKVKDVFAQIAAVGGVATLVVPDTTGMLIMSKCFPVAAPAAGDDNCPIHPDSEISFLLEYLLAHRADKTTTCVISTPAATVECSQPIGPLLVPA